MRLNSESKPAGGTTSMILTETISSKSQQSFLVKRNPCWKKFTHYKLLRLVLSCCPTPSILFYFLEFLAPVIFNLLPSLNLLQSTFTAFCTFHDYLHRYSFTLYLALLSIRNRSRSLQCFCHTANGYRDYRQSESYNTVPRTHK